MIIYLRMLLKYTFAIVHWHRTLTTSSDRRDRCSEDEYRNDQAPLSVGVCVKFYLVPRRGRVLYRQRQSR